MSTFAEVPSWIQTKEGSDNHFEGVMIALDNEGKEISSRPTVKDDLSGIADNEAGRGGAYMWKKGDNRHSWTRRYFEVKQQIVYYFAEPTDEKPLGVIPLDGCQIKVPPQNDQFFEDHNESAIKECYEFWISHPHRRLFCICAKSREERQNWVVTLVKRTKKGYTMGSAGSGMPLPNPTDGVSGGPPPGLQGADETPIKGKKKKKKKTGIETEGDTEERENAVKDLLNMSRRASEEEAQLAMQNTSTLRRRLSSAMTPDALKAIADPTSPAAVREKKKPVKKQDVALENWKKKRMELIKKLVDDEKDHPMTLSFLLRGQLIALDRVMAEPPHPNAKVDVPHIKGDWAGEVVISVFNRYSNKKGQMEYENWLSFMEDIDLVNTHLGPSDDVKKFNPTDVWRKVLRLEAGKDVDSKNASFPEFYTFLLVLCDRAYSDIFQRSATEAMELFLHEVIVPIYYFHMGETDHEKCASRDPLVKDGRITLLLNAYLPNLWRVFLHYAQDLANRVPATFDQEGVVTEFGTHKPLPEELAFPSVAQASERALFEGVTNLPSLTPESGKINGKGGVQVYTIHTTGILRFCEDYGLNEIVTKNNILRTYKRVVSHRFKLKGFAPPKVTVRPHPMANKSMVKGGKPRSPVKRSQGNTITGSPAFKPVGSRAATERIREQEFRERSGSLIKTTHMGSHTSIDEALRVRASAPGTHNVQAKDTNTLYTPSSGTHAPHAGDKVQVPSEHAGFCEFIEIISGIAILGMCQDGHHHKMYPSAYDKVLALLCIWGVADVTMVERAKFMWPYDKKVPKQKNQNEWVGFDDGR